MVPSLWLSNNGSTIIKSSLNTFAAISLPYGPNTRLTSSEQYLRPSPSIHRRMASDRIGLLPCYELQNIILTTIALLVSAWFDCLAC